MFGGIYKHRSYVEISRVLYKSPVYLAFANTLLEQIVVIVSQMSYS